jgi:phage-related protein
VTIEFYRTADGKCPVQEYLLALNPKQRSKAAWTLDAVRSLTPVPAQYLQKMSGRINSWEVRVIFSGDIFRLLGYYNEAGALVLCHGFTKKTQKTPQQEIETAEARKADNENRKKKIR